MAQIDALIPWIWGWVGALCGALGRDLYLSQAVYSLHMLHPSNSGFLAEQPTGSCSPSPLDCPSTCSPGYAMWLREGKNALTSQGWEEWAWWALYCEMTVMKPMLFCLGYLCAWPSSSSRWQARSVLSSLQQAHLSAKLSFQAQRN